MIRGAKLDRERLFSSQIELFTAFTGENGIGDVKTFRQKLEGLCEKDLIRKRQIDFLDKAIYDAGSAAMHRSYNPSATIVTVVLDAIESLIHTIYIESLVHLNLEKEKPKKGRLS